MLTFSESTKNLVVIDLNSVRFGHSCDIGLVTSEMAFAVLIFSEGFASYINSRYYIGMQVYFLPDSYINSTKVFGL